jgi:hypothetical protein
MTSAAWPGPGAPTHPWASTRALGNRPLHVRAQRGAELRIVRQRGVVDRSDEAVEEPSTEIAHISVARMQAQHCRMVSTRLRVPGWPAHDLRPVGGEAFDVLGVLAGMRERMVQLRILETPRVVGGGEGQESLLTAGELVQRGPHVESVARRGAVRQASRLAPAADRGV